MGCLLCSAVERGGAASAGPRMALKLSGTDDLARCRDVVSTGRCRRGGVDGAVSAGRGRRDGGDGGGTARAGFGRVWRRGAKPGCARRRQRYRRCQRRRATAAPRFAADPAAHARAAPSRPSGRASLTHVSLPQPRTSPVRRRPRRLKSRLPTAQSRSAAPSRASAYGAGAFASDEVLPLGRGAGRRGLPRRRRHSPGPKCSRMSSLGSPGEWRPDSATTRVADLLPHRMFGYPWRRGRPPPGTFAHPPDPTDAWRCEHSPAATA